MSGRGGHILGGRSSSFEKESLICREWDGGPAYSGPGSESSCNSTGSGTERDWCALRTAVQLGVAGGSMH